MTGEKRFDHFLNFRFIKKGEADSFITGQKEFIALPTREKILIDKYSISQYAKRFYIPFSVFACLLNGVKFSQIDLKGKGICFFDIETTDEEEFRFAYVKGWDDKKPVCFEDVRQLGEKLKKYDWVIGHNLCRFDYVVLFKYLPELFVVKGNDSFRQYIPLYWNTLDTYSLARLSTLGKDGYKLYSLARELGYRKKRIEEKNKARCRQDVELTEFIYQKGSMAQGYNWITDFTLCDCNEIMNTYSARFIKQALLSQYLQAGFLPIEAPRYQFQEPLPALHFAKPGLYSKMSYQDIQAMYPTTFLRKVKGSLYQGEKVFEEVQGKLFALREKKPLLKPFVKCFANVMIGSMRDQKNIFKNEQLWSAILTKAHQEARSLHQKYQDKVVYINTDCFVVPQGTKIRHNFYKLSESYAFDWFIVYDSNRVMGKLVGEEKIFRRHFKKGNYPSLLEAVDNLIDIELFSLTSLKELKNYLNSPSLIMREIKKKLFRKRKENLVLFKRVVRKITDLCDGYNADLAFLWDKLKYGFNELYLDKDGHWTLDKKKCEPLAYEGFVREYLKLYSLKGD